MPPSPSWTIEQIEDALANSDGDLGIYDGVQYHVRRTDDEGGNYRVRISLPGTGPSVINVVGRIK